MTSQAIDRKPLVLKDELAKLARDASPASWLKDAHGEIEAWRQSMPGASRRGFTSFLREDGSLELRASDGWGRTEGFALYAIESRGVRFYTGQQEIMPNTKLTQEEAFIAHLLELLSATFELN